MGSEHRRCGFHRGKCSLLQITIPRSGLRTAFVCVYGCVRFVSPSHTVGLEHIFLGDQTTPKLLPSSHPMGLEPCLFISSLSVAKFWESPSHTVGSELSEAQAKRLWVIASRHPTQWARNVKVLYFLQYHRHLSPSHAVGLEPLDDGRAKPEEYLRLSPSHTVGS